MNEQILQMALEAGFVIRESITSVDIAIDDGDGTGETCTDEVENIAQLVAKRCAEIIEAQDVDPAFKYRMAFAILDEFGIKE